MKTSSSGPGGPTSGWTLDAQAFDRLLAALDADRRRAAVAYEDLRRRLIGLLQWWGASPAEDLADETLDRVARKLDEGAVIGEGSLGAYVRGVAKMIVFEANRRSRTLRDAALIAAEAPASADNAAALAVSIGLSTG